MVVVVVPSGAGGVNVNVASTSGNGGRMALGTSRADLSHIARQFAVELAPSGVLCAAAAGTVDTHQWYESIRPSRS